MVTLINIPHSTDEGKTAVQYPVVNTSVRLDSGPNGSKHTNEVDVLQVGKIEEAIEAIGMGRYQWELFFVTGFGYFSDNLWPIVTGLILPAVAAEFTFQAPFLKLGQNIGLLVGAAFWGIGADIWGRRLNVLYMNVNWCISISFNITLLITGIFALAAGGSPNAVTLCILAGMWSIGVGGNLPVDSALFLESIPSSYHYLLTVLSIWWAFGQLVGSLVAWPLIARYSCPSNASECPRSENQGWRYFLFCVGGLMLALWFIRFFVFKLYESPRWLCATGRVHDACGALDGIAAKNGYTGNLNLPKGHSRKSVLMVGEKSASDGKSPRNTAWIFAVIQQRLEVLDLDHVRPLFSERKLAYLMTLLISIWGT
ncbi:hypothetical protein D9619_012580 [Psilocybe cf. subviscida]|uniref:Major facilitator superfamily (MFS) profile domain-containing protein n=1 Tax=Psilocybe cf. subviscida TaxID=2480587 RepID=A0A8H5B763_9AGAR|nr:hypothetical protein D9619_012580 [Psilocybe cf. subviscida]